MKLNKLVKSSSEQEIEYLSINSQDIKKNTMFFCVPGFSVDRHDFVDDAIAKGAVAIVHSKPLEEKEGIAYILVEDVQLELDRIAGVFYDHPSDKLNVYAVTGTNGKSTTSSTLRHVLNRLNSNTGYIGTISIEYNDHVYQPSLTTPDVIEMNQILSDMVAEGVNNVCLEVSSQGLAMGRVDSINFDTVAFTNLSHDHLDYHKTMEAYFEAKKHLFELTKGKGKMIVNIDDSYGARLAETYSSNELITVSLDSTADYRAINLVLNDEETHFDVLYKNKLYPVKTNLLAKFNVYNLLEVIAMVHQNGYDLEQIIATLVDIPIVKGRVNFIEEGQAFNAVVDYSHTPDGFHKIYGYLKGITNESGRLITVYGNAGGRDHAKRPVMGEISDQYCDLMIITEQDKRTEKFNDIIKEMVVNVKNTPVVFIENRYDAIEHALNIAEPNDTVVILGKGDEKFQYGPQGREPWIGDDNAVREILIKIMEERK